MSLSMDFGTPTTEQTTPDLAHSAWIACARPHAAIDFITDEQGQEPTSANTKAHHKDILAKEWDTLQYDTQGPTMSTKAACGADLRAGVAAVAAHHEDHVDRPHVDALDDLLDVRPAARRALP